MQNKEVIELWPVCIGHYGGEGCDRAPMTGRDEALLLTILRLVIFHICNARCKTTNAGHSTDFYIRQACIQAD